MRKKPFKVFLILMIFVGVFFIFYRSNPNPSSEQGVASSVSTTDTTGSREPLRPQRVLQLRLQQRQSLQQALDQFDSASLVYRDRWDPCGGDLTSYEELLNILSIPNWIRDAGIRRLTWVLEASLPRLAGQVGEIQRLREQIQETLRQIKTFAETLRVRVTVINETGQSLRVNGVEVRPQETWTLWAPYPWSFRQSTWDLGIEKENMSWGIALCAVDSRPQHQHTEITSQDLGLLVSLELYPDQDSLVAWIRPWNP